MSGYVKPILPSLTFIVMQDAGHSAPIRQRKHAADMIEHLLSNTPFPKVTPKQAALQVKLRKQTPQQPAADAIPVRSARTGAPYRPHHAVALESV